jgi:hypothetical protein
MEEQLQERSESLWRLAAPPLVWALHLLLSYCTAAIYCTKYAPARDASLGGVRVAIGAYTVVSLLAIGVAGVRGYQRHRFGDAETPHDFDTPEDRHRFLGFATFLLAAISAVAVVYQALPALFIGSCR